MNSASRYLLILLCATLAACALPFALFQFAASYSNLNSTHDIAIAKLKAGEKIINTPRLVTIGGSNVLYGIDSNLLTEKTGIQSVNYGLHAALGLPYLLDWARRHIRQSDIVLILPESHLFSQGDQPEDFAIEYVSRFDLEYLFTSAWHRKEVLFFGGSMGRALRDIWTDPAAIFARVHTAKSLNARGDETVNSVETTPSELIEKAKSEYGAPFYIQEAAHYFDLLKQFRLEAEKRGIKVYFSWSAMMTDPTQFSEKTQSFYRRMEREMKATGIQVLGRPEDYLFPLSEIYDTPQHLNAAGRRHRTLLLATQFCALYPCPAETPNGFSETGRK